MADDNKDMEVQRSADSSLSRSEFLTKVVKGAALTGGLLAAPKVLDKFLVPAAYAQTSTCALVAGALTQSNMGPNTDQVQVGTLDVLCLVGTPRNDLTCQVAQVITSGSGGAFEIACNS